MLIPSFYVSREAGRSWSLTRAAAYGAGLGALAGLFKSFGPSHAAGPASAAVLQVAGAAVVFALLCAGAALLRNIVARRFIWSRPD